MASPRLDFTQARQYDTSKPLRESLSTVGSMLGQFQDAELKRQQLQQKADQDAIENQRAQERLALLQSADTRAVGAEQRAIADRNARLLATGADLSGVGFTIEQPVDVTTTRQKTPEEVQALIAAREKQAYATQQGTPEYAALIKEIETLQADPVAEPQSSDVWNQFIQGIRPEGSKYSGEMRQPTPAPETDRIDMPKALADIDARRLRGEITDSQATQERTALIKSRGQRETARRDTYRPGPEKTELEVQQARQSATASKKTANRLEEIGMLLNKQVEDADTKIRKALTKDDLTNKDITSIKKTISKDRNSVAKDLRKAMIDSIPKDTPMTPELKAAMQTRIDERLKLFDDKKQALEDAEAAIKLFQAKEGLKKEEAVDKALQIYAAKARMDASKPQKGDITKEKLAEAEAYIEMYGNEPSWMFGFGLSDDQELKLKEARAKYKQGFKQETR